MFYSIMRGVYKKNSKMCYILNNWTPRANANQTWKVNLPWMGGGREKKKQTCWLCLYKCCWCWEEKGRNRKRKRRRNRRACRGKWTTVTKTQTNKKVSGITNCPETTMQRRTRLSLCCHVSRDISLLFFAHRKKGWVREVFEALWCRRR